MKNTNVRRSCESILSLLLGLSSAVSISVMSAERVSATVVEAGSEKTFVQVRSQTQCSASVNGVMPGVVLDFLRLSAALEGGSLVQFKILSAELSNRITSGLDRGETTSRSPASASTVCQEIPNYVLKRSQSMFNAANLAEARGEIRVLSQLIAEWAVLFHNDDDVAAAAKFETQP